MSNKVSRCISDEQLRSFRRAFEHYDKDSDGIVDEKGFRQALSMVGICPTEEELNSMKEDISSNYMCYPTSKELWDNVSQMYSDLGNQSQIFELTIKLGEIRQGDNSVTKYFNSLKRLW